MTQPPAHSGRALLGVLPGVVLVLLHSAMIDLPRADIIDALDTDRYRFQWVTGSYLVGGAAGLGLTRWLAGRLGLRLTCCGALLLFSSTAALCGMLSEVIALTPLRLLQGLGAGLVLCSAMVLLWREFGERKPLAMAVYGTCIFLAALVGPVLGGLLVGEFSWRALFLLNLPLGLAAAGLAWQFLTADRPVPAGPVRFDYLGFVLFVLSVATLNVVLDMGQYWGWLTSPFFVPWLTAFVVFAAAFVLRGVLAREPFIDLRLFALRNYGLAIGIKAAFSINLYVLLALLSGYMINLRGYQWWQGGLVLLPAALGFAVGVGVGFLWGGRRVRMFAGLAVMALATWLIAAVDLYTDKRWLAAALGLWGGGAGLVIVPVMLTLFEGLTEAQTLHCAGIYNMTRLLPAYVALMLLITFLTQRSDVNFDRLRQDITYNRPQVSRTSEQLARHFADRGSSAGVGRKQTHATLGKWVHANSRAFALQTVLEYLALAPGLGLVLVLFVRGNLAGQRPSLQNDGDHHRRPH